VYTHSQVFKHILVLVQTQLPKVFLFVICVSCFQLFTPLLTDTKEHVQQDIEDICKYPWRERFVNFFFFHILILTSITSFAEFMKTIEPPNPVHEFQNIFLTGATGFVGRCVSCQYKALWFGKKACAHHISLNKINRKYGSHSSQEHLR
jgi:hypothetical protein